MKKLLCIALTVIFVLGISACAAPAVQNSNEPAVSASSPASSKPAVSSSPAAEVVVFDDPILEKRVREQMNKPDGDITVAEAEAVENLNVDNKDNDPNGCILDISALKHFTNLKTLYISLNNITDISVVAGMKNLVAFYSMNGNDNITDFSPLSGLTNMLDLSILSGKNINDNNIAFIKDMTKLEMLWISDAPELTDISAVANFTNLVRLNINKTGISDISPVAGLTNMSAMDLSGSKISDVSPLKGLVNLKNLFLKDCPIKDYTPLKDIYPKLEEKDFKMK
jgi:internalin A